MVKHYFKHYAHFSGEHLGEFKWEFEQISPPSTPLHTKESFKLLCVLQQTPRGQQKPA